MSIGNFGEIESPESEDNSGFNSGFDAGDQIEDNSSEKLDTGTEVNALEYSEEPEADGSEKLESPDSDNDYSYKHPDEGNEPEGDFSYNPENNLNRESYEDDDPGEKSPYTRKLTR